VLKKVGKVIHRFKNIPTKNIELICHDEPAWFENIDTQNFISYN
jgi:hypothetical protein